MSALALLGLVLGVARGESFRCPTCQVDYGRSGHCTADGAPLEPTPGGAAPTRVCGACDARYADGARFCPRDGKQLTLPKAARLAHVQVGQEYVFEVTAGEDPPTHLARRVVAVEGEQVRYTVHDATRGDGGWTLGPARGEPLVWPPARREDSAIELREDVQELPRQTARFGCVELTCRVRTLEEGIFTLTVWTAVGPDGKRTFPDKVRETFGSPVDPYSETLIDVQGP